MNRHNDHLLAAYIHRQLPPDEATAVYAHISSCAACYRKFVAQERLAFDLQHTLYALPEPRPGDLSKWWNAISLSLKQPERRRRLPVWAPMMLSLMLLVIPLLALATGRNSDMGGFLANDGTLLTGTQAAVEQVSAGVLLPPETALAPVVTPAPPYRYAMITAAPAPRAPGAR